MSTLTELKSRDEILKAFTPLLRRFESQVAKVATKAEAAQQAADLGVANRAAGYSVEGIIKGLAELQLTFGAAVDALSRQVEVESVKLGELRLAIDVERRRHSDLHSTRVAADALEILKQDHARRIDELEAAVKASREALAKEAAEKRAEWAREKAALDLANAELEANLAKERKQAEEDHGYEAERQAKLEADADAERRRELDRELADKGAAREKEWAGREQALAEAAAELEALRVEVAGYEAAIDEAAKRAREQTIASVNRDAKHEAELLSRETAANLEVYELKITSLEETITSQSAELEALSKQLAEALAQSQTLAHKAMQGKGA